MDNEVLTLIAGLDGGTTAAVMFYIFMAHVPKTILAIALIFACRAVFKYMKTVE